MAKIAGQSGRGLPAKGQFKGNAGRVMTKQEHFMKEAIRQAKEAYALDEVPIGCVIVLDDKIIARGYNRRNTDKTALAHAEIAAIKKACRVVGDWRLEGCTMYVTSGTLPDVRRGHRAVASDGSRHRMYESESRMCRFHLKPAGNGPV